MRKRLSEMAAILLNSKVWRGLGHIFRLKTIGDILGWWTTAAWVKVASVVIAAFGTAISWILHGPMWLLPIELPSLFALSLWIYNAMPRRGKSGATALLPSEEQGSRLSSFGSRILLGLLVFASFGAIGWYAGRARVSSKPDDISRIETKLVDVPDAEYRRLVAAIIYAFEPTASLSVGALENTPDGARTVDIELRSIHDGKPTLTAIDIINLPLSRKADIATVDAADSKRSDIRADAMLLCSNTGFEVDAISKAKRKKIGLISVLRQGDKRINAVIEEEIYLREVRLHPITFTYT